MEVGKGEISVCLIYVSESLFFPVQNIAFKAFLGKHVDIAVNHISEEF